jgi:hypothetical protein
MPSIYRMPAGRSPPCRDHPEREGGERCSRCRAFLCDACTTEGASGVTCLACAARAARRRRPASVAVLASAASAAFLFAYLHLAAPGLVRAPSFRSVQMKAALRQCSEQTALMVLLDMHAAREDSALLAFGLAFDEACSESPMVLAMAYRGACSLGDTRTTAAIAERLAALPADAVPGWRCLPCGDRPRVCGAEPPRCVAKAPPR